MLSIVIDNSKLNRCNLLNFCRVNGLQTNAMENGVKALRDLAIQLKLNDVTEIEALAEMRKSLRYITSAVVTAGVDPAVLMKVGEQDILDFLQLAQPLRARPVPPTEKPTPVAEPGDDGIIDVEFEIVDDPTSVTDCFNGPVLYAQAA